MGRRDRMLSEKQEKKKLGRPRTANWLSGGSSAASQSSCQGFRSSSGVLLCPLTHRVYQAHVFPSQIWLHLGLKGCIMPRQTPAPACKWDIHEEKEKKNLKNGKLWFQRQTRFEIWKFWVGWRWGTSSGSSPVPQRMWTMVREQKLEMPDSKLRNRGLAFFSLKTTANSLLEDLNKTTYFSSSYHVFDILKSQS